MFGKMVLNMLVITLTMSLILSVFFMIVKEISSTKDTGKMENLMEEGQKLEMAVSTPVLLLKASVMVTDN
jgi:hypothetical protein